MNENILTNNKVYLEGQVETEPHFSHELYREA